ncbi:MAG: PAS domain S-box protein, partial [Leptothrix sp. (in: Bacteria)]|nr:PAS domain S-box protein [Leptothrix sp. (in: b-proteobacteria)]
MPPISDTERDSQGGLFAAPRLIAPKAPSRLDRATRVHLVDGDAEQAAVMALALAEGGYEVRVFSRLADLRAALGGDENPDAIVMEMSFPEGDQAGAALVAELQAGPAHCPPVVFTTVRDDLDARVAAHRAGARRYLLKPVAPDTLIDLLDALTGRLPQQPWRVLLVDDDPALLEAQSAVLRAAGMTVQTLERPRDTLLALDAFRPDVLVLDLYMPEISGPELSAVVRQRDDYLSLPILFLSSETDTSRQLLALSHDGDDFLVKPMLAEHLVAAVIARARRARQNAAVQHRLQVTLYEREREHLALDHHAIVSIADRAGTITYANDNFCRISGYSRGELLRQNQRLLKSGEHPPAFYADMWRTISAGRVWQGEVCNRRKDGSLYWVASTITPVLDEDGSPCQYVSMRTDITRVKAAEAAQRAQNAMRQVLGQAAAELLAASADTLDAAIDRSLQMAGEHLGADRAYLFQLCGDGTRMCNSHEWRAPRVAPKKDQLQDLPVAMFAWWWAQMKHGESVQIPDVAAMPPESAAERASLESQDIRALCAFPFRQAHKTVGFIGFDQVGRVRDWDAQSIELLGLLAGLVGSALLRAAGERALTQGAHRLNATLEATTDGILAVGAEGQVLFMNQQFRRMWNLPEALAPEGVTDEQLLAQVLTQLVDPQGFLRKVQALYRSQEDSNELIELTDARVFERHSRPLRAEGHASGRVWSFHDVTERRRAEQAAEAAKERLRRGQLYANIGTWEWNIVTGALFWTERIAPLFGYPTGELETSYDNFLTAVHPDDRQAVIDAAGACVERDAPYEIEHRVVRPDGTVRWLLERGAVQRDAAGKPLKMIGVVQDIDDRKRAELALAERERQLLEAQRLASIGTWTADLASGRLVWSDETYRIFGHQPGSFAPSVQAFHAAVHPDDRELVRASEQRAEVTGHLDVVHRTVRPDGSVRHVHELAQMQLDDAGKPLRLTGTVQDMTERMVFEQALVAAREAADRANQAKSEFLSSMSHELRTPMNAILGFGQLMEADDNLPAEHRDNVKEVLKAGRHLLGLISEVLDLAKVESGHIDLSLEPVRLVPVVDECIALLTPLAALRGIALGHEGLAGAVVRADRLRLKQGLLNLLSNAIKYNRDGGTVHLDVKPAGLDSLRIRVTDSGPGIPAGRLAELFQPFNRLGAEGGEIEGTGIGLTITRRIVELMGGTVGVASEFGVGSCFWIELPLETRAAAPAAAAGPAPAHDASARPAGADHHTVLYIEDNPANLKLVAQILAHAPNIHLLTAHTPSLGIELALAHRPALVLLDINMPGMDGYQVLQVLQAEASLQHTPVIAITANAMPRDIEHGRAAGFSDYLTKPLDVGRFLASV